MKICIIHINASPNPSPDIETPPQRFMRHITPYMALDVDWGVVRLMDDDYPADIHDYDGYLITGGAAPLVDEPHTPKVVALLDFIRQLNEAKIPLVGICWGHQGIAIALGGKVEKFEKYGMGIRGTHVIKKYDWMKQAPDFVYLYSMHTCQVTIPPKDAELFLSSDFCHYAGFTYGNHIMTIQQHPDFNLNVSLAMMDKRRERLTAEQLAIAEKSLSQSHHTEIACQWVGQFFMQHKKVAS